MCSETCGQVQSKQSVRQTTICFCISGWVGEGYRGGTQPFPPWAAASADGGSGSAPGSRGWDTSLRGVIPWLRADGRLRRLPSRRGQRGHTCRGISEGPAEPVSVVIGCSAVCCLLSARDGCDGFTSCIVTGGYCGDFKENVSAIRANKDMCGVDAECVTESLLWAGKKW